MLTKFRKTFLLDCCLQALHPSIPVFCCFNCEIAGLLGSVQVGCKVKVSLLELLVETPLEAVEGVLQLFGVKVMNLVAGRPERVHKKCEPEVALQSTEQAVQAKCFCLQEKESWM